ncbi:MAG: hypothetical protein ACRDZO_14705 [Egibacteraceae bacterium]
MVSAIRGDLATTYAEHGDALATQAQGETPERARELYLAAIGQYVIILQEYADTPAAGGTPDSLIATYNAATLPLAEGRYCDALPVLSGFTSLSDPEAGAIATMANAVLPQALYECGIDHYKKSNFRGAIDVFATLAGDYRDSPLVAQAKPVLIAAKIADIRGQQPVPGELSLPSSTATGGTITLEVFNYAPDELTFLYSGPASDEVVLPACPDCPTYASREQTPDCVPDDAKPKITLRIPAGTYETVGHFPSEAETNAFSGSDVLDPGFIHYLCYYEYYEVGLAPFAPRLPVTPLEPVQPL